MTLRMGDRTSAAWRVQGLLALVVFVLALGHASLHALGDEHGHFGASATGDACVLAKLPGTTLAEPPAGVAPALFVLDENRLPTLLSPRGATPHAVCARDPPRS